MLLTHEQELLRDAVRAFAREQLAPNAAQWDRDTVFPAEALKAMAAMGMFGITVPEEWEGAGMDYVSVAVAIEEIAAGDGALAHEPTPGGRGQHGAAARRRREGDAGRHGRIGRRQRSAAARRRRLGPGAVA